MMQAPVMVLNTNTKRETGRTAQLGNIEAAKAVSDIVRTTLGPRSMLKMLLDPMGGIVMTNDGNAILREVDVAHPAAKSISHADTNTKRETGRTAQLGNIEAAKAVSDIVRTTLGPRSMLKMLLDPMGGIVMTNDGNAILREVDVAHPAAKSMIELSRAQDEEVGDGTTSVIILAGELLVVAEPFLSHQVHPTVIIRGFNRALNASIEIAKNLARTIDIENKEDMRNLVQSSIGTKFSPRVGNLVSDLALDAVLTVVRTTASGRKEVDVKRYAKVEKIPGGELEDSRVLKGVMFNKDVTHSKMRRRIENPRVLLLDCPLEYKKGESQTNVELTNDQDWNTLLRLE
ncbi:T-complex protein 1 subunit gamma, partial [Phytophthora palmivora]